MRNDTIFGRVVLAVYLLCLGAGEAQAMGRRQTPFPLPPICRITWNTVDDFLPAGATGSRANAIASGSKGIFAAGKLDTTTLGNVWITRRSTNLGDSWQTVDQLTNRSMARAVAVNAKTGTIYVAGTEDRSGRSYWTVRKSVDNGASWRTVDSYLDSSDGVMEPNSVAVDGNGIVYVAGYANVFGGGNNPPRGKWIVRRSADGGATWRNVDVIDQPEGANAYSVVASEMGRVWVAGSFGLYPNNTWIVRFSSNGTDFRFVDEFNDAPGKFAVAYGGAIRSDASVVFVGEAVDASGFRHWIARKSVYTAPDTWVTTDEFPKEGPGMAAAYAAAFNVDGRLYITGTHNSAEGWGLLTRRGSISTHSYSSRDRLFAGPLSGGNYVAGLGVTVPPGNDAFVAGVYQKARVSRWIVRQQRCL